MARSSFQSPKGIRDVLPEEQPYWHRVEETIRKIVRLYGYERLDLPVFEETALYRRGVGEGTDIVEKEMYTFLDRSEKSFTLRPEFTAGVMRAYIEHGLAQRPRPFKVWSLGPVFRYERPQAGRYRQHTQFNVEALGEIDPALDFEIMSVAYHLYSDLGFRNLNFQINSIGCPECRPGFLKQLTAYYAGRKDDICEDCRKRLDVNPLRLLDCKVPACQPVIESAPRISGVLCDECRDHFARLRTYLDNAGRPYVINHRLVRGLDYYTKTVFEVWAEGIGAQNAVCGGGRYDGLAEAVGGVPTPAVGFASGIERIVLTMQSQDGAPPAPPHPAVFLVMQVPQAGEQVVSLLAELRAAGVDAMMAFGGRSMKAQMREANKRNAEYVVIIGERELADGTVTVKYMDAEGQETIARDSLIGFIRARLHE
ncbi:histidine--tRNA ligase [bacterium]|nr:histidine--tRNA ligase [bacterium]